MSPKNYQEIRTKLGRGSGRDSPGFKAIICLTKPLWKTYQTYYLEKQDLTLKQIYDSDFNHNDAYIVAEALLEFEILFQRFLSQHMQIINRSIGVEVKSLRGNEINKLNARIQQKIFPELWVVRNEMTGKWGKEYGFVRNSLTHESSP